MTLMYFTARNEQHLIAKSQCLIYSMYLRKYRFKRLNAHKAFVLKKLEELGTRQEELNFLASKIDFENCKEDSIQASTVVDW